MSHLEYTVPFVLREILYGISKSLCWAVAFVNNRTLSPMTEEMHTEAEFMNVQFS